MERVFTQEERGEFERAKEEIQKELRQQQPDTRAIVRLSNRMYEIKCREWYLMDGKQKLDQWTYATFKICSRYARDFFTIGEHLRPEDVPATGLGRKALCQLALTPEALRQDLIDLVLEEDVSHIALSAGRCAAEPIYDGENGDLEAAREKLVARARARQAELDAELEGRKKRESSPKTPQQVLAMVQAHLDKADKKLKQVDEALEEPMSQEARDTILLAQEQVAKLQVQLAQAEAQAKAEAEAKAQAQAQAEQAAAAEDQAKEDAAGAELEFRAGPAHSPEPAQQAPAPAQKEPDFTKVYTALGNLEYTQQCDVAMRLYFVMRGDPAEQEAEALRGLRGPLTQAGVPGALFDEWHRRLCDPDPDRRSVFALRSQAQAYLPNLDLNLKLLRQNEDRLPPALRQVLQRLAKKAAATAARDAGPP